MNYESKRIAKQRRQDNINMIAMAALILLVAAGWSIAHKELDQRHQKNQLVSRDQETIWQGQVAAMRLTRQEAKVRAQREVTSEQ